MRTAGFLAYACNTILHSWCYMLVLNNDSVFLSYKYLGEWFAFFTFQGWLFVLYFSYWLLRALIIYEPQDYTGGWRMKISPTEFSSSDSKATFSINYWGRSIMLLIFIKCDYEQCARVQDDSLDCTGEKHGCCIFYPASFFIAMRNLSAEKKAEVTGVMSDDTIWKMKVRFHFTHFHKRHQFCLTHFHLLLRSCSRFNPSLCEHPQSVIFLLILYILVYLDNIYKAKLFLVKYYVTLKNLILMGSLPNSAMRSPLYLCWTEIRMYP